MEMYFLFSMTKPGPKPSRTSNPSWTPELAYACGLIATDGSLSKDGRHINLTSKDVEQLETFKRCIGINNKIAWKSSGSYRNSCTYVQFGDVVLYKWLISIGITPKKTFTIGVVNIPDNYFADYLRGEFDGDGSTHAYWDTRWHSSVSLYLTFVCASKKHLRWLRGGIKRMFKADGLIRCYTNHVPYLLFAKTEARKVFEAMYYSDAIPFLKRKKDKFDRQWSSLEQSRIGKRPAGFKEGGSIMRIA
jgi:hypothetical protein